jgi:hypothetical protein
MKNESALSRTLHLSAKGLFVGLVVILFSLLIAQKSSAGTSNTIPKYGFLGGVTAYASIKSLHIPGSSNGDCGIHSYTSPATHINVIGWTWWQCDRMYPDGSIAQSIQINGDVKPGGGSSYSDGFTWINAFTGGVTKLKAHGVHDFNHTGSNPSPWQPYNVNVYP